jgi:hypothetical protein
MAVRKPLTNINGVASELPVGDQLGGLAAAIANGQAVTFEQIPIARPERPSLWITAAANQLSPGTATQVANTLRAFPWEVKRNATIATLRSEVSTLLAATSYRLALYADSAAPNNSYPGALIAGTDAALYDASTAGVKPGVLASAISVTAGTIVWVAINCNGAFTARALLPGAIPSVLGMPAAMNNISTLTCWSIAQAFGAMPATFPAGATVTSNISAPYVIMQTV